MSQLDPPTTAPPPTRRPLRGPASAFALFLAALWGGNPVAIKAGLDDAPPLRLGWMRFVLGSIFIVGWALVTRRSFRVERSEWRTLVGIGLIFTAQLALMNVGQDRTTAGHAAVITSTFPLWTGLLAHFLVAGDRLSRERSLGTLVAYAGVVVVLSPSFGGGDSDVGLDGDALLLASAVLLGARQIYISYGAQRIAIHKLMLAQNAVGVPVFVVVSLIVESDPWIFSTDLALALLYQGLVIAGFGFLSNAWLLQRFLPSHVSAMQLTTPVFGIILSALVLGEAVGWELYAGTVLVVAGSLLAQRAAFRGAPPERRAPAAGSGAP